MWRRRRAAGHRAWPLPAASHRACVVPADFWRARGGAARAAAKISLVSFRRCSRSLDSLPRWISLSYRLPYFSRISLTCDVVVCGSPAYYREAWRLLACRAARRLSRGYHFTLSGSKRGISKQRHERYSKAALRSWRPQRTAGCWLLLLQHLSRLLPAALRNGDACGAGSPLAEQAGLQTLLAGKDLAACVPAFWRTCGQETGYSSAPPFYAMSAFLRSPPSTFPLSPCLAGAARTTRVLLLRQHAAFDTNTALPFLPYCRWHAFFH